MVAFAAAAKVREGLLAVLAMLATLAMLAKTKFLTVLKSHVARTSAFRRPKPLSGPVRGKMEAELCNRLN
jgi:hypothetical protein